MRLSFGRVDAGGFGAGRAVVHRRKHAADCLRLALKMRLDRAVGEVADPAGEAEATRGFDRPVAVEHALDLAVDYEVGGGHEINLPWFVSLGLTRGPACSQSIEMERETRGGWVYLMTDRYCGTMYVGVIADLPARVSQHRLGTGSGFCARYGLTRLVWAERLATIEEAIEFEKRLKRWQRAWKFELIEKANPDWNDLFNQLV